MKTVGITGASGFVGSALKRAFNARGWSVVEIGRHPSEIGSALIPFDLTNVASFRLPEGLTAVIHAAYRFGSRSMQDEATANIAPSLELLRQCRSRGTRFFFISSMAAFPEAKSIYGRGKFAVEKQVLAEGESVVRPGFVVGEGSRGLVHALAKFLKFSPFVPLIGSGLYPLYLCNVTRLAEAIVEIVARGDSTGVPVVVAERHATTLAQLLTDLALRQSRRAHLIPIPASVIFGFLKLLEFFGLRLPFRSDSVLSLMAANPSPFADVDLWDLDK